MSAKNISKNIYELSGKFNTYMEIDERDKKRFESIVSWSGVMMDLSIKERIVREYVTPQRGEVWTVDFGENVGTETNNTRPCLIIQNDEANLKAPTVVGVPITNHEPRFFSHQTIMKKDYDSVTTDGNIATGSVMLEQVRVLSKGRIGRKIGKLSSRAMQKIEEGVLDTLGINKYALGEGRKRFNSK